MTAGREIESKGLEALSRSTHAQSDELAREFSELTIRWKQETSHCSRTDQIAKHPAYRAIIAMGEPAIPLILEDLDRSGGHWFQALREITKANPVPASSRGKVGDVRKAWLNWGREHGHEWARRATSTE